MTYIYASYETTEVRPVLFGREIDTPDDLMLKSREHQI